MSKHLLDFYLVSHSLSLLPVSRICQLCHFTVIRYDASTAIGLTSSSLWIE
jgi:hypothetical protein